MRITVSNSGDVYTIVSEEGTDTVTNVEEFSFTDMTLSAAQMDAIAGGTTAKGQLLVGETGDDAIFGVAGSDTIRSGASDDSINSGSGNDDIKAGDGNDTIDSGSGDDRIFSGADTFVFNSGHDSDVIHDFELDFDILRLSSALTNGKSAVDIVSDYATITNGAVVFDFGGDDIITISNLDCLTGLSENIEIFRGFSRDRTNTKGPLSGRAFFPRFVSMAVARSPTGATTRRT